MSIFAVAMQSWLTDALNKAKVTADTIRDSVAWQPLALYACETDAELQAHLEREGTEVATLQTAQEVLKRWTRHVECEGDTRLYRVTDPHFHRNLFLEDADSPSEGQEGERSKQAYLTFREVFLRSNALEKFFTAVARRKEVRKFLLLIGEDTRTTRSTGAVEGLQPRDPETKRGNESVARARDELLKLIKRTLDLTRACDEAPESPTGRPPDRRKLFLDVVYLLSTTDEACTANLPFVACVISMLKCDWRLSFVDRYRGLALRKLESLKAQLSEISVPPVGEVSESDANADVLEVDLHQKQHELRVNVSRQYVDVYTGALHRQRKLEACQPRLRAVKTDFVRTTMANIDKAERKYESSTDTSETRETRLREELAKSTNQIAEEIQITDGLLRDVDAKVEAARAKREDLLAQLKGVDSELEDLLKQRNMQLTTIQNLQEGLSVFAASTKKKLVGEERLRKDSKLQHEDLANIRRLLKEVEGQSAGTAAANELSEEAFNVKVLEECVQRHLAFEKGRLQHLLELLSACVKALKVIEERRTAGASEDETEERELVLREQEVRARHAFAKALSDLDDVVWPAIQAFIAKQKNNISGDTPDVVAELDRLYTQIKVDAAPHFRTFLLG